MRWQGRRESDNIEDRRSEALGSVRQTGFRGVGVGLIGRGGLKGVVVLIIIYFGLSFFGYNPSRFLFGDGALETKSQPVDVTKTPAEKTDRDRFIATILAETEDTWTTIFRKLDRTYRPPILVRFRGSIQSDCGFANAATGPFYCSGDQKLYLDDRFFDQLAQNFGAPGEFAQAYVIAHEVGHHVQTLLGTLSTVNAQRQRSDDITANALSVRIELQADCYAGIWAHYTNEKGILEDGDVEAALNAAHKIGDDVLQKRIRGYVVPDSFTHGSAEQRAFWFKRGFTDGTMESCDTFKER